jgi:hypothetical protein
MVESEWEKIINWLFAILLKIYSILDVLAFNPFFKTKQWMTTIYRGEIRSHPENGVPQTIVLRYQEMGGILCTKQRSNGIVSI